MRIVVTGSSSGIGRALAIHLLEQGHQVLGLARSAQEELIHTYPDTFIPAVCDVSHPQEVIAATMYLDRADALICCAAVQGQIGPIVNSDPDKWMEPVAINLGGTYNCLRSFWRLLLKAEGRPKIICFSGGGATKARPNFSGYAASKTGVVRLVETFAEEQPSADVNAVAPGVIHTAMTKEIIRHHASAGHEEFLQACNSSGDMSKVIALVDWLLSTESDKVSGRLISAVWDDWRNLLMTREAYRLRRVVP